MDIQDDLYFNNEDLKPLKNLSSRFLKNIIRTIYFEYPDLKEDIAYELKTALEAQTNDGCNDYIDNSNLPCHPDHYTLADFDSNCLSDDDKVLFNELINLQYIDSRSRPNLLIYGPPGQGKEKLLIAFGDLLCHNSHSVKYYTFHDLMEILTTHGKIPASNTKFDEIIKIECLLISDFAGKNIYDPEELDCLLQMLIDRKTIQTESKRENKWKPKVTYIDTCYALNEWTSHFQCDKMKVLQLINLFYGQGIILTVDESASREEN